MNIRIAVLDTGVTEEYRKYLSYAMMVDERGMVRGQDKLSKSAFAHGTYCLAIIRTYFKEAELSSIQILDETGRGTVEKLAPAFEWCFKHGIDIVNVSFGTTNFRDRERLLHLVDDYASRGLVVIAASANSGYTTYPASFSSVIGVGSVEVAGGTGTEIMREWNADFACHCLKSGNIHTGVDILAPSVHEVKIGERKIVTVQSNSYAAPFVTAWAGTLLKKHPGIRMEQILKEMRSLAASGPPLPVQEKEEVPVVVLSVTDTEKISESLHQICGLFQEEGYHAYALQVDGNQIIYGTEHRRMFFSENRMEELKRFLGNELYYKKCDILIVMAEKNHLNAQKMWVSYADLFLEVGGSYKKKGWNIRKLYEEILGQLVGTKNRKMS